MRSQKLALLAGIVLLSTGCSVKNLANRIEKQNAKMADTICSCDEIADAFEGAGLGSCEDLFTSFEFTDCQLDALETDKKASKETLSCQLELLEDANNCLDDKFECSADSTAYEECTDLDYESCPELPESVYAELEKCNPDEQQ